MLLRVAKVTASKHKVTFIAYRGQVLKNQIKPLAEL